MGIKRKLRKKLIKHGYKLPYMLMTDEEKYLHRVVQTLSADDIAIDLGAHIGKISRMFATRARKVYAFEPNPETFKVLQSRIGGSPNIVAIQKAVSDKNGTSTLFFDPSGTDRPTEGSTLTETKQDVSYDNGFEVETVSLASFVLGLEEEVKLIKIDIEGLEYRAINDLIDSGAIERVGSVYVEDHCFIVEGLEVERDATLAKIERLGLTGKFHFDWP